MSKTDYLSILQAGIQKAKQSSLDKAGEDRANRERKDARLRRITDIVGPRLADLEEQLKDAGIKSTETQSFPELRRTEFTSPSGCSRLRRAKHTIHQSSISRFPKAGPSR